MDIHSNNRLAIMEHEQRVRSIPVVPEYDAPNVEIQPGWALRLVQRFVSSLGHSFQLLDKSRKHGCETTHRARMIE